MTYSSETLTHNRSTCVCNLNLHVSCPEYRRNTEGGWTFTVTAIREWKLLNVDLKWSSSARSFKHSYFISILDNQILTQSFMHMYIICTL